MGEFASQYAETLYKTSGYPVCITDKDSIIAIAGASKKDFYEKPFSVDVERIMEEKTSFISKGDKKLTVTDSTPNYTAGVVCPIISDGDTIGNVIVMQDDTKQNVSDTEFKLANAASMFLAKQMEI